MASGTEVVGAVAPRAGGFESARFTIAIFGALVGLAIVVYYPVLYYMVDQWSWDDNYSHGFLIVPLAAWFAYERKNKLKKIAIEGSWLGLIPLAIGTLTLGVGRLGVELMNMRSSFVFTVKKPNIEEMMPMAHSARGNTSSVCSRSGARS